MSERLDGMRVAMLVTDGFEEVELTEPRKALDAAGAITTVVSPKQGGTVRAWRSQDWGQEIPVDLNLMEVSSTDFDALVLPGGVMNPDHLRQNPAAVGFVADLCDEGKPIAAICHGPWTLIDANRVKGRRLTSWPSLRCDLQNAGAEWVDEEAVIDGQLLTSRNPSDLPVFNREMIELFGSQRMTA